MRIQLEAIFVLLLSCLSLGILAAPTIAVGDVVPNIYRRALDPEFTFTEDLKDLPKPSTPPPGDKKGAKAVAKYNHKQNIRQKDQLTAASVVTAALQQAQGTLGFPDRFAVTINSNFHTSNSDSNKHVTFNFNNPKCGTYCVGHAYNPAETSGKTGQIWNSTGGGLWGQK